MTARKDSQRAQVRWYPGSGWPRLGSVVHVPEDVLHGIIHILEERHDGGGDALMVVNAVGVFCGALVHIVRLAAGATTAPPRLHSRDAAVGNVSAATAGLAGSHLACTLPRPCAVHAGCWVLQAGCCMLSSESQDTRCAAG